MSIEDLDNRALRRCEEETGGWRTQNNEGFKILYLPQILLVL
jgi:hypothetical protein